MIRAVFEIGSIIKTLVQIMVAEGPPIITFCFDEVSISSSFSESDLVSFVKIDATEIYSYECSGPFIISLDIKKLADAISFVKVKKDDMIEMAGEDEKLTIINLSEKKEAVVYGHPVDRVSIIYPSQIFTSKPAKFPVTDFLKFIKNNIGYSITVESSASLSLVSKDEKGEKERLERPWKGPQLEIDYGGSIKTLKKINNLCPKGSVISVYQTLYEGDGWGQIVLPIGTFGAYILLSRNTVC